MKGSHQQASLLSALSKQNLIPLESIDDITDDFIGKNIPFIRFLIENKSIDGNSIAKVLSKSFGHPQIQLSKFDTSLVPDGVRNEKLITKHNALPLYLEEIQFNTGYSTELVLCDEKSLQACIEKVLEDESGALDISDIDADELAGIDVEDTKKEEDKANGEDDAPIVVFINKILLDAIKKIYILSPMKNHSVFAFVLTVFYQKLLDHQ